MKKFVILVLLIVAPLSVFAFDEDAMLAGTLFADANWKFRFDKKNIVVHTSKIASSKYNATRLITEIDASPSQVLSALGEPDACVSWVSSCYSSKVLETISSNEVIGYAVLKLPIPLVKKRDLVYQAITKVDSETGTISRFQFDIPNRMPDTKYVRMSTQTKIIIEPLPENRSKVTWYLHAELGGNLSPRLANGRAYKVNYKDFKKLIKLLAIN